PHEDPNKLRPSSTGPWRTLIENAREVALEEVRDVDQDRVFYRKPWWQKAIIMCGGPAMNFVLAFILFAIVMMGFGVVTQQLNIPEVPACVKTSEQFAVNPNCAPGDKVSPAAAAGLRPGDKIVSIAGRQVGDWDEATRAIRAQGAGPVAIGIERGGQSLT